MQVDGDGLQMIVESYLRFLVRERHMYAFFAPVEQKSGQVNWNDDFEIIRAMVLR